MQEFNTKQDPHKFIIDGRTYWLPAITLGDFETADQIQKTEPPEARIPLWRDFVASRVRSRFLGRRAVRRLTIIQLMQLWRAWVGLPGEASSSSSDSLLSTPTSSPSTSDTSSQSLAEQFEATNSEG